MKKIKQKVYLDTSVYNRPFDEQSQTRVKLETEAFLTILEKVLSGRIIVVSSSALEYENSRNPFPERKERVADYLSCATVFIKLNETIRVRAVFLEQSGIDPVDALHIAHAESAETAYFVTCDDILIKKANRMKKQIRTEVCNPLEFVLKEVL